MAESIAALLPLVILSGAPNPVSSLTATSSDSGNNTPDPAKLPSEPEVVSRDSRLYVVWSEYSAGNREIFFKHSIDNGLSFSQPINLSNTTRDSLFPSLTVSENFVKVSWLEQLELSDDGAGFARLQRTSTDYGLIFGPAIDLDVPLPTNITVDDARRTLVDDVFARSLNSSQTLLFIKSGGNFEDGQRQPSLRLDIPIESSTSDSQLKNNNQIKFQYFAYVNDGSSIGSQCSDIRLDIYLDGVFAGSSNWVGYEARTQLIPLDTGVIKLERVTPDTHHTLTLIPEGRLGGCNVGWVNAWGGIVILYK